MRDHSLAGPGTEPATPSCLAIPELVEGIEVVEWPERQQRKLDELEAAYRKLVDRVVEQSEELAALRIEDAPPPHY